MADDLTCGERHLRRLMQIWMVVFGIAGFSFLVIGDDILAFGNWFSSGILHRAAPAMPLPVERFWLSLTFSMMMMLTALCYYIQRDVRTNKGLTVFVLISKLSSTLAMLFFYFADARYFNYLMGSVFCDGPIFLVTFFFYCRAVRCPSDQCPASR